MGAPGGTFEVLNDWGLVDAVVELTPEPDLNDVLANGRVHPILLPEPTLHFPPLRRPTLKLEVVPVDRLAEELGSWVTRWRRHQWRLDPAHIRRLRVWVASKPAGWFTVGEAAELAAMNVAVPANKIGARRG